MYECYGERLHVKLSFSWKENCEEYSFVLQFNENKYYFFFHLYKCKFTHKNLSTKPKLSDQKYSEVCFNSQLTETPLTLNDEP